MNITGDEAKARITGQPGYAGVVKSVINSALKRVGRQQYGKYDIDTYTDWKWNQVNPPRELNCWASVVNWAWHGSAINSGWLQRYVNLYVTQITDIMTKNAGMATLEKQDSVRCFLLGQLNSVFVQNVTAATDNVVVPPGRTVFFKNPATGPMSHVALSIGGGMVVSNWRVPSVAEDDNFNLRAGYVHVETIGKLAYLTCQPSCEVRMTPRPFWEMRICNI